jgi:hypothetical protein
MRAGTLPWTRPDTPGHGGLPRVFSTVTVTWDETDVTASPIGGTITFQVSDALCDMASGQVAEVLPPKSYSFSGAGSSGPLVANDSPGVMPPSSYYTVTIAATGQRPYSFATQISHADGSTQALAFLRANTAIPGIQYARYMPLPSGQPAAGQVPLVQADGSSATAWGPVPADKDYTQAFTAAAAVTVTHGLGKRPAVTVIDSADDVVVGDVAYIDTDSLTVSFSAPFSGTVICNLEGSRCPRSS